MRGTHREAALQVASLLAARLLHHEANKAAFRCALAPYLLPGADDFAAIFTASVMQTQQADPLGLSVSGFPARIGLAA